MSTVALSPTHRLRAQLSVLEAEVDIYRASSGSVVGGEARMPIASLSKLFVLAALRERVREEPSLVAERVRVAQEDLCGLSAGINQHHLGRHFTVAELARLTATLSDNTACDILGRLLGERAVLGSVRRHDPDYADNAFPSCHDVIRTVGSFREHGGALPHQDHQDWFHPLRAAASALRVHPVTSWNPWMTTAGTNQLLLHKGGRTPGVFSSLWRWHGDRGPIELALTVVANREIGYIDEHLIHQAGHSWVIGEGLRPESIERMGALIQERQ